jgi:hypothetical protein
MHHSRPTDLIGAFAASVCLHDLRHTQCRHQAKLYAGKHGHERLVTREPCDLTA